MEVEVESVHGELLAPQYDRLRHRHRRCRCSKKMQAARASSVDRGCRSCLRKSVCCSRKSRLKRGTDVLGDAVAWCLIRGRERRSER